jgi:hypothetical protein
MDAESTTNTLTPVGQADCVLRAVEIAAQLLQGETARAVFAADFERRGRLAELTNGVVCHLHRVQKHARERAKEDGL